MTDQITTTTSTTEQPEQADLSLAAYGSRDDIVALSKRIRTMLPGGEKLTPEQAMSLAQYSIAVDANPYRGEVYGWTDARGKFHLTDGYKLLVRWAKRQCNYSEKYDPMPATELKDGDIGYRCWILRDDARPFLQQMIQAGADFREAFEIAATSAVGVVKQAETWSSRNNKVIDPPKGWTWDQVARKRALKNALNLSHGAPSPREIAAMSWQVGDTQTTPADWQEITPQMTTEERERTALLSAQYREQKAEFDSLTPEEQQARLDYGRSVLRGEEVLI